MFGMFALYSLQRFQHEAKRSRCDSPRFSSDNDEDYKNVYKRPKSIFTSRKLEEYVNAIQGSITERRSKFTFMY